MKRNLPLQKSLVDIVAITIVSPLKIGIYENGQLKKQIIKRGKTSDVLPAVFDELLKKYEINSIIYSNGPGSYMAIKLSFIFFKTLQITKNIKFFGCDGFEFNHNQPIKAVGNTFFVKKESIISIEKEKTQGEFFLPENLNEINFSEDVSPLYVLKPV